MHMQIHTPYLTLPDWDLVMRRRLGRLRRGCAARADESRGRERELPRGYVFHRESGLAYCHIPKVASTFWLEKMARLLHPEMGEQEVASILEEKGEVAILLVLINANKCVLCLVFP